MSMSPDQFMAFMQQQAEAAARRDEQMAQMHMQLQQQQAALQQDMARMSMGMQGTTASAASTGDHVQQLLSALVKGNDKGLMGERGLGKIGTFDGKDEERFRPWA